MYAENMGSAEWLTRNETALILGVTPTHISYLARQGLLLKHHVPGKPYSALFFSREEVSAYAESKKRGKLRSLPEAMAVAEQAWAAARVAQRELAAVKRLLGIDLVSLSLEPADIKALYLEAGAATPIAAKNADSVNVWVDKLFGVNDIYLERVAAVMNVGEPWKPYDALVRLLLENQDYKRAAQDAELRHAYTRVAHAHKQLRESIFLYLVRKIGHKRAVKYFPHEFEGDHFDVMIYATKR